MLVCLTGVVIHLAGWSFVRQELLLVQQGGRSLDMVVVGRSGCSSLLAFINQSMKE